jgi:hypothetical protein
MEFRLRSDLLAAAAVAAALMLGAGCTVAVPGVGDGSITCNNDRDCEPGELCDTVDSPHYCFAAPGDGGDAGSDAGDAGDAGGADAGDAGGKGDAGMDAGCVISGQAFAPGAVETGFSCAVCDPAASATNWSAASDGTPCSNGGGDYCLGGTCTSSCLIDGGVVLAGALQPGNGCQVCNPDAGTDAYSSAAELTACVDAGNFCHAGQCALGCGIDGGFVASWTPRDAVVSGCCNPGLSTANWTPAFAAAREVMLTSHPSGLAVNDFNGDGVSDFAATEFDNTIDVYLAQTDGGFFAEPSVSFSPGPTAIVSSVFTSSKHADLALLEESAPAVQLFYGSGDGTFVDGGTVLLLLSDLNSIAAVPVAGPLDLLMPGTLSSVPGLDVFQNQSGGFDQTHSVFSFTQGTSPWALTFGMFRDDAGPDVAVLNNDGSGVDVFVNNGGTLKESQLASTFGTPQAICTAELNGDGLDDFAVVSTQLGDAGIAQAYLSLSDGGFAIGPRTLVGARPVAVMSLLRRGAASSTLAIADGKSGSVGLWTPLDGGLALAGTYPAGSSANAIATGDFNGDGLTDLAVSDPSSSVYILYGQCR